MDPCTLMHAITEGGDVESTTRHELADIEGTPSGRARDPTAWLPRETHPDRDCGHRPEGCLTG